MSVKAKQSKAKRRPKTKSYKLPAMKTLASLTILIIYFHFFMS